MPEVRSRSLLSRRALLATLAPAVAIGTLGPAWAQAPRYGRLRQVREGLKSDLPVTIEVAGGAIDIVFADGAPGFDRAPALAWVRGSAETVAAYLGGRFPVPRLSLLIVAQEGRRVGRATTWGYGSSTIRVAVGRGADAATYARDWVMVHEMLHLMLPTLPANQFWALEGSATYAEPVARARLGKLSQQQLWRGMVRGMPQGLPAPGDAGLDHTSTWGRTYWGGAIFWLLADVRIRRTTRGKMGVEHAFRAINAASGGNRTASTMERIAAVGDRATGTGILSVLYAEMRDAAAPVDLPALFASLGVIGDGRGVRFDDGAPLAAIRQAIGGASPR
ncbi:hypothetical protein [Sphingopyxis sp. PET50]|uniref:hypothetical protein n=1 Tax=Sphingopyxis sp. PET50 TaxID=2976533 RepID=UPI0021AEA2F8|nr:hypothetical protein [Sphingopyxis sp. PET50]